MANRYWVGGTGTWNSSSTAHWSASNGGSSGASVPTRNDVVIFNGLSGGGTVTMADSYAECFSLDASAFTGSFSTSGLPGLYVYEGGINLAGRSGNFGRLIVYGGPINQGNVSMTAISVQTSNAEVSFNSDIEATASISLFATSSYRIDANSRNLGANLIEITNLHATDDISLGYIGGTITKLRTGNANVQATFGNAGGSLYLQTGTGSIQGFTFNTTVSNLSFTKGSGSIDNLPSTFNNSGSLYISGDVPTSINQSSGTNTLTFAAGGRVPTLTLNGGSTIIQALSNNTIANNLVATSASQTEILLEGANTAFTSLTINGPSSRVLVASNAAGTRKRLWATASFSLANISWRDIEAAGTIPFTGTNFEDLGNNLNINLPGKGGGLFFGSNF